MQTIIDRFDFLPGRTISGSLIAAAAVAAFSTAVAPGAQAADYYKDKTLTVMVASRAGGGTDTTARLVARFWGDHIPGKPDVLVRNKSLQVIAANELQLKTRPEGLVVGVFAGGGTLGPFARKSSSVRYDPTTWEFAGTIERGPSIQLLRKSALKRLLDPKAKPIAMGSVSTDRTQDAIAVFGAEYLGWNLKFVLGYPNSNAIYLAYGRGEIDMFGSGTSKIIERFLKDEGAMALVAQTPRRDFPNVKTFEQALGDKMPKGAKWEAYAAWTGPSAVDKFFAMTPKTPKDIVKILQTSFKETTEDPRFDKQATNILGGGYSVISPEKTLELIKGVVSISPDALKEISRLRKKYGLPKVSRKAAPLVKVKFDEVQRDGRVLIFSHKGKKMKLRVSGGRSEIMVGGKIAPRAALKTGMTCQISWAKRGDRIEARKVVCP